MKQAVRTTCCLVLAMGLGLGCLGGCGKKDETIRNDGETSGSTRGDETSSETEDPSVMHPYGVFLSAEGDLTKYSPYETIVIDAQNFDAEEIRAFKDEGHTVYSYINVGALEDFRDYYDEYKDLSLGAYEHWEEEVWIDVSDKRWMDFLLRELVPELLDKGIDGFFVDNCDGSF